MNVYDHPTFNMACQQFDAVADHLQIAQDERPRLKYPKRTMIVSLPIHCEDGSTQVYQSYNRPQQGQAQTQTQTQALPTAEGEVRKVDKATGKISLRHGDIKNLDMPPMSMVFQVKDPALLNNVKAGDKVRFTADQINGDYTVMSIEVRN